MGSRRPHASCRRPALLPLPLLAAASLLLTGCEGVQSALDPQGPRAAEIATMILVTTILGGATWLLVSLLLIAGLIRRPAAVGGGNGRLFILGGGVAFPAVVMVALWAYGGVVLGGQDQPDQEPAVTIEVVGHQWWWEIRYPDLGVVTANEMHIPTGVPVALRLTSDNVVHSFWVPALGGKIDLLPGHTSSLWLQADEPGTFRGQCAEFCGIQHARMAFHVVAHPPEEFEEWAAEQAEPAEDARTEVLQRGQEIFLGSACSYCHTVRGTNASGRLGPDLTHLASRQHIAAGTVPLSRGSLAGWIVDPQGVKPGALMPGSRLSSEELQSLLAYLMSLD